MTDFVTRKLDLPFKINKGRIRDLTGDIPSPYLVQRPSKGEILVKTTQHKSAAKWIIADKRPRASSWSWHQLLQYVPTAYDQSPDLKMKLHTFVLFHQVKKIGSTVHCKNKK